MKALRITAPCHGEFADAPDPVPGPGEVLIQVARIGLCGSDLSTWRGANPLTSYPRIPGHEISGTVVASGAGESPAVGAQVLVIPYTACGACSACRAGRSNCCRNNQTLGVQRDGACGSLLAIPASKLMSVPGLDLTELALVEPLSVGFHASARARIGSGETVVVIGCGAVGIGAVAGASARGARVVAVDVDPRKLELAVRMGAQDVIDASVGNLQEAMQALDGGEGPAATIEAAGQPATFRAAVEASAYAGRVVYIGYAKGEVAYDTRRFVQKELDVLGSRNALREDFSAAAAWLAADHTRAGSLVSRMHPFADAIAAFQAWDAEPGAVCKIILDVADPC